MHTNAVQSPTVCMSGGAVPSARGTVVHFPPWQAAAAHAVSPAHSAALVHSGPCGANVGVQPDDLVWHPWPHPSPDSPHDESQPWHVQPPNKSHGSAAKSAVFQPRSMGSTSSGE